MRKKICCVAAGLILLTPAWVVQAAAKSSQHDHASKPDKADKTDKTKTDKASAKTKAATYATDPDATIDETGKGKKSGTGEGKGSRSSEKSGGGKHGDHAKKGGHKY